MVRRPVCNRLGGGHNFGSSVCPQCSFPDSPLITGPVPKPTISEHRVNVGEIYRYKGETRRRDRFVVTYRVRCPTCKWEDNHAHSVPAARHLRDGHVCET